MADIYYGEQKCGHIVCHNKAYWLCEGKYLCGVHTRGKERSQIPKRPKKEKDMICKAEREQASKLVEIYKGINRKADIKGTVVLSRLIMMKKPENIEGYLKVFPNFRHQHRKDGFGCSSLSPMSLGPINHGQPGLPPSLNLENFHQGNKVFKEEVDVNINPTATFYNNRLNFYNDVVPHRHKYHGKPHYSIWVNQAGVEQRVSYVESRQFYCIFYERLATQTADFKRLQEMLLEGYNLQICGYDAYPLDVPLDERYLDPSKPFGHEIVLYTLLTVAPDDWPWRKHTTYPF